MRLVTVASPAAAGLLAAIRGLLDDAFAGTFTDDDWAHTLGGVHVVLEDAGAVLAHAAVVPRRLDVGGRAVRCGYLEGVATAPARQGGGLGTLVLTGATALVRRDFEMGALSTGCHHFYERLGWRRWRGPTFVRHGAGVARTPDDDDALMVLLAGASEGLDPTAPIVCEARPGDPW